jgi:AraC-like DNA-binding protein
MYSYLVKKCPINRKSSHLANSADGKGRPQADKIISLALLARLLDRSPRTVREYCKKGIIPEAYETPGGHWRIPWPLSLKTRDELIKRRADYPFKARTLKWRDDMFGDWEPDIAESLLLAHLFKADVSDRLPVLQLAEIPDHLEDQPPAATRKQREARQMARRIQAEIIDRGKTGRSFSDMILIGRVYQYSRTHKDPPTVVRIADFMGISRDTFYRLYTAEQLNKAYRDATGALKRHLPHPDGLDAVQRANLKAKVVTIDRDPYADD